VLVTSSGSHKLTRVKWDDVMYEKRYSPLYAYKQSKLCNLLFAKGLSDRFADRGVRAYGIDPGLVRTEIGCKNTGRLVEAFWRRRMKHGVEPAVPAEIYVDLIGRDIKASGFYYDVNGKRPASREVTTRNADRLFDLSERLCGIKFGVSEPCMS
jgi:NAD(P)-dependent dehydrogenase (short-subunit alcohol dehydrogenase family)